MTRNIDQDLKILEDIFYKAVALADPVKKLEELKINAPKGKTFFTAVGKGAGRLAKVFKEKFVGEAKGIVVIPENEFCEDVGFKVYKASHPLPSKSGLLASRDIVKNVSALRETDLFVFIISGGASSLLPYPPEGFSLDDEVKLNLALLESGAPISIMNFFRSQFSQIKGGKLGMAAYPCPVVSLVVCDIPGDDLSLVGSGPTFLRDYSELDVKKNIDLYEISFNRKILNFFLSSIKRISSERIKKINTRETIALSSGSAAIAAAEKIAKRKYGLNTFVLSDSLEEDAETLAASHASIIRQVLKSNKPVKKPAIILSGGEGLINLPKRYGKGGRNSHFALALAKEITGLTGVSAFAADTDGIDGKGNNAGAFVSGETFNSGNLIGVDMHKYLKNYDSYNALNKIGSLFISGPTGVNLNDLRAIIVR